MSNPITDFIDKFDRVILRSFSIPPPITCETLKLKERGLLQPELFTPTWWAQRGYRVVEY